ncbi:MAG TPA: winged-helix domain-containing protein [Candidatus Udaeobacter sp.]|nr:winged-helix domain-containing protein [Candidatus Udaeobacter sp.]
MNIRGEKILNLVIENYIANAEPVGSKFLVSAAGLDLSEATVRNELRALEEEGYLTHPHTSAGRIPTEKGYKHYIKNLNLAKSNISKNDSKVLVNSLDKTSDHDLDIKSLAKTMVELSNETVIIAFSPENIYYTGLTNLFNKPEFDERSVAAEIFEVFDNCEDSMEDFFAKVEDNPKYFFGNEHPFGEMVSVLSMRFGKEGLVAILGPQRMDYKYNFGLMKKLLELI